MEEISLARAEHISDAIKEILFGDTIRPDIPYVHTEQERNYATKELHHVLTTLRLMAAIRVCNDDHTIHFMEVNIGALPYLPVAFVIEEAPYRVYNNMNDQIATVTYHGKYQIYYDPKTDRVMAGAPCTITDDQLQLQKIKTELAEFLKQHTFLQETPPAASPTENWIQHSQAVLQSQLDRIFANHDVDIYSDQREIRIHNPDLSLQIIPLLPCHTPIPLGEYTVFMNGKPVAIVNYTKSFEVIQTPDGKIQMGSGCMLTFLEETNITVLELSLEEGSTQ